MRSKDLNEDSISKLGQDRCLCLTRGSISQTVSREVGGASGANVRRSVAVASFSDIFSSANTNSEVGNVLLSSTFMI